MKPPGVTRPGALPRGVRFAAVLCLVLSTLAGVRSCQDANAMLEFDRHRELQREAASKTSLLGRDPAVTQALVEAELAALAPMRESRAVVLLGLSMTCTLLFFASSRLLRAPDGIPRDSFRQLLGGAGILAAVLRTIDGAQLTVVARNTTQAMLQGLQSLPEFQDPLAAEQLHALIPFVMTAAAVGPTLLFAGGFAALAQYFRSQRVRDALVALDGPERDDV